MNFVDVADNYAGDVIIGRIPACEWIILACKRYLADKARDDIYLDAAEAERWCKFQQLMPHVKGAWASRREKFRLEPFQVFITVNLYGWRWTETGIRRFREAFILIPRKNGKTFYIGTCGMGHFCLDDDAGKEIYCGATSEIQAMILFNMARQMCTREPFLTNHYGIEVNKKVLNIHGDGSKFEPVIGNPGDGGSPNCGIVDEYHEHKTTDLADTFVTGMGARQDPPGMMLYISTAGVDIGGPCYEKQLDCLEILKGAVVDDSCFVMVYTTDEDDPWDEIESAIKANPNYGVSVDSEFLKVQLEKAKRSAVAQSAYRTKHLNHWVGAKAAWMNMLAFQACRRRDLVLDDYAGERCIIGIDLASTSDLASMAIFFPYCRRPAIFCKHYLPEDTILEGGNTRYKGWHADGWITATPGQRIDYDFIEEDLLDIAKRFHVEHVPYDPFQATQFSTHMDQEGLPMVQFGQTVRNFSEPMKELESAITKKEIDFQEDPVLMWAMSNVVAKIDKKDNIFPDKERASSKIDPVVACIMAYGVYVQERPTGTPQIIVL